MNHKFYQKKITYEKKKKGLLRMSTSTR